MFSRERHGGRVRVRKSCEIAWRHSKLEIYRQMYVAARDECTFLISQRKTQYMSQMLTVRESMHHIRHLDVLTLDLPRTNYRTVGDRAFKVAAPTLWNALPIELRIIKDITVFKRKLKTYYFEKAFD